jgi:hypothetical protein
VESPQVWFTDVVHAVFPAGKMTVTAPLDPVFYEVCEKNSFVILGLVPDKPCLIGGTVTDNAVCLERSAESRSICVTIHVAGIRRGCLQRFPHRTYLQMLHNNAFWSQAKR